MSIEVYGKQVEVYDNCDGQWAVQIGSRHGGQWEWKTILVPSKEDALALALRIVDTRT